jgi:hypothetical protein
MPDFYLDFMTSDVWDGLVIGVILIGMALAVLRLYRDRARYIARQKRQQARDQAAAKPIALDNPHDTD